MLACSFSEAIARQKVVFPQQDENDRAASGERWQRREVPSERGPPSKLPQVSQHTGDAQAELRQGQRERQIPQRIRQRQREEPCLRN